LTESSEMIHPTPKGDRAARALGRRRRQRAALLCVLATGVGMLLLPRGAEAGSYMVRQCTASNPSANASWQQTSEGYRSRDRCRSGGGLQVYHQAPRTAHGRYGAWVWRAPDGTVFTSLRVNASLAAQDGHRGELWMASPDASPRRLAADHRGFRVYERRGELSRFEARLRCARAGGCGSAAEDRAHAYVKGVFLRVTDRVAPTVTSIAGALLDDEVVRGPRTLAFTATDRGGGVRRVSVEANGAMLGGAVRECDLNGRSTTRLVPCPLSTTEVRSVATTHPAFVTGPNTVSACAEDLALGGLANRSCEGRSVWVDNVCPASRHAAARLRAAFVGGGEHAVVRSDRGPMLAGRLTDRSGQPVRGATICVLSRVRRHGAPVKIAVTEPTDADGRYAVELPPGPNREIFVHHAHGAEVLSRHGLAVRSRVRPTLTVRAPRRARRGDALRFRGRIPGPACAGRLVEVQARLVKRRWQVFRTGRTDGRCRFAIRYRLRATTRPTRYRFRARVRRQPGYPYQPGRSAVRSKQVVG
jgi:hypothetical protein